MSSEYMKIIYENCGVKNCMKEDHPQFTFNASSAATAIHFMKNTVPYYHTLT